MLFSIILLTHQVEHYSRRLAEARTIEERIFLRTELYNLKQSLQSFYN